MCYLVRLHRNYSICWWLGSCLMDNASNIVMFSVSAMPKWMLVMTELRKTQNWNYSRSGSSIVCNSIRWFSRGMDLAFVYIIYCSRSGYTFACGTNMFLPKYTEMFVVGIGIGMNYENREIITFLRKLSVSLAFAPVSCGRLSCCMCWA